MEAATTYAPFLVEASWPIELTLSGSDFVGFADELAGRPSWRGSWRPRETSSLLIVVLSALLALLAGSGLLPSRLLFPPEQRRAFVALVVGASTLHLLTLLTLPLGVVLGVMLALAVVELAVRAGHRARPLTD